MKICLFGLIIVLLIAQCSFAGNPIVLSTGAVLRWTNPQIPYVIDLGNLGFCSENIAQQLVILACREWSNVPHSLLNLEFKGLLEQDVTSENFNEFFNHLDEGTNPVIFDNNGEILDMLRGQGASEIFMGYTSNSFNNGSGEIKNSTIILNGKLITDDGTNNLRLYSTMLHEIGHFVGLDHSQVHTEFAFDNDPSNNLFLPIMFPLETNDMVSPLSLSQDDKMTLKSHYPGDNLNSELGTIKGTVIRPTNEWVQGANVVAVKVDTPLVDSYSVVSDLLIELTGEFVFNGIPPGEYELLIEPIDPRFVGPARVGPFAEDEFSPSFLYPVTKEYYNGERENGYINRDDPQDREMIRVKKGETVSDIEFITNEEVIQVKDWSLYD